MDRRTAKLVNAIGYRRKLANAPPDMKRELLSLLDEGKSFGPENGSSGRGSLRSGLSERVLEAVRDQTTAL